VRPVVLGNRLRLAEIVRVDDNAAAAAEALGNGVFFFAERVCDLIRQPFADRFSIRAVTALYQESLPNHSDRNALHHGANTAPPNS